MIQPRRNQSPRPMGLECVRLPLHMHATPVKDKNGFVRDQRVDYGANMLHVPHHQCTRTGLANVPNCWAPTCFVLVVQPLRSSVRGVYWGQDVPGVEKPARSSLLCDGSLPSDPGADDALTGFDGLDGSQNKTPRAHRPVFRSIS